MLISVTRSVLNNSSNTMEVNVVNYHLAVSNDALMFQFTIKRALHTAFRPSPLSAEDRTNAAKHALLAFNIMIAQSIKPDVFMYTHLIRIMGDAGFEWQAYKLFARMLEQGVQPLPETYAALKQATHSRRSSLHDDISRKLEETWRSLPSDIAKDLDRNEESQRLTLANDVSKMSAGTLIPEHVLRKTEQLSASKNRIASVLLEAKQEVATESSSKDAGISTEFAETDRNDSYASMKIDNPPLTWETFKAAQEASRNSAQKMKPDERVKALQGLSILHDDELRIFLAVHRQLRHGPREALVTRILDNVPYTAVMGMLQRRVNFFAQMRQEFREVIDRENEKSDDDSIEISDRERKSIPNLTRDSSFESFPNSLSTVEEQLTMPQTERSGQSMRVLYTPWGFIKEPIFKQQKQGVINPERNVSLSKEEEDSIVAAAHAKELDRIAPRLLRQFARQHGIKWKRRSNELYENVQFHVLYCMNVDNGQQDRPKKEEPVSVQKEDESTSAKPTAFEMLRAITRYSAEVKAVDDDKLNAQIKTLMEKQRSNRIRDELQRNKEKSRSKIPLLVKYRMRRAGVEPFDEVYPDAEQTTEVTDKEDPWGIETAEEDLISSKTIIQRKGSKKKGALETETFAHGKTTYEETQFGRYRPNDSNEPAFEGQLMSKIQSEHDTLVEKKAKKPLNASEQRQLNRCKKHLFRMRSRQARTKHRKDNPPNMIKRKKRMMNRL